MKPPCSPFASDRPVLRLYVTGMTACSTRAITNLRALCQERLGGQYDLEVIDLLKRPHRALEEQVIVTPTLIKETPGPVRRLVGDLSDTPRLLAALDLCCDHDVRQLR